MSTKICNSCSIEKELTCFRKNSGLSSYRSQCNECLKKGKKVPQKPVTKEDYKLCSKCKEEKHHNCFSKSNNSNTIKKLFSICKSCCKTLYSSKKKCEICEIEKTTVKEQNGKNVCRKCFNFNNVVIIPETLTCSKCKEIKGINFFRKDKSKRFGVRNICNICDNKKYQRKTPIPEILEEGMKRCSKCKVIKKTSFFCRSKNSYRAECKDCKKKYNKDNKEHINTFNRNKRKENILFRMSGMIRSNIRSSMKAKNYSKTKSTILILGCNIEQFKKHIESQFLSWMSWDNQGLCTTNEFNCSWHLDHIIPISTATTEEEVILLNHWSNFQPLCSKVNLEKQNKVYPCTNLELKITFYEKK